MKKYKVFVVGISGTEYELLKLKKVTKTLHSCIVFYPKYGETIAIPVRLIKNVFVRSIGNEN